MSYRISTINLIYTFKYKKRIVIFQNITNIELFEFKNMKALNIHDFFQNITTNSNNIHLHIHKAFISNYSLHYIIYQYIIIYYIKVTLYKFFYIPVYI